MKDRSGKEYIVIEHRQKFRADGTPYTPVQVFCDPVGVRRCEFCGNSRGYQPQTRVRRDHIAGCVKDKHPRICAQCADNSHDAAMRRYRKERDAKDKRAKGSKRRSAERRVIYNQIAKVIRAQRAIEKANKLIKAGAA